MEKKQITEQITRPVEVFDVNKFNVRDMGKLFVKLIPAGWKELFDFYHAEIECAGQTLSRLVINNKHVILPYPWDVFRAFTLTPWPMVKIVIIGQDPYYLTDSGIPSATGCSFECRAGTPIRRSLENIFIRLATTVEGFESPEEGDLTKWAQQGVLLLNASLTVNENDANSHKDIWEFLCKRTLGFLRQKQDNIVYMLWGRFAQKLASNINKNKNLILEASHPVARGNHNTFFKCNHFNQANEYLEENGIPPIDWKL